MSLSPGHKNDITDHTPLIPLQKGTFQPPSPTSIRSACPIVNTLANHGLIPRDGRSVRAPELAAAIRSLGISSTISTTLTYAAFLEYHRPDNNPMKGLWAFIKAPFAFLFQKFGLRGPQQKDAEGHECLNLDQLNRPGVVEHDVSMTRRDAAQGNNHSRQDDLVADLIASSSNGELITTEDLAHFRRQRLEQARKENPYLVFEDAHNMMACSEAAFVQRVFGDREKGWAVPVEYARAIFAEERLPIEEGWRRRSNWWKLGFVELFLHARVLKKAVESLK